MKSTSSTKRSGFTLIELLTVIAIIGILAAVLFPGVQGVMKKAKQSTASTKLRNIIQAAISLHDGKKFIGNKAAWDTSPNQLQAKSIADYACVLAYGAGLNTAELWYVDADWANESANFPKYVLNGTSPNTAFTTQGKDNGYYSWAVYTPTSKNLDANIPLIWTRGLLSTGKWDTTNGVWRADGGHIGYGDSHVTWNSDTIGDTASIKGIFVKKSDGSTPTMSISEAIGTSNTIYESSPPAQ
jgi:prepilin-type N-terminal cleavage/methylation domain-containing protein